MNKEIVKMAITHLKDKHQWDTLSMLKDNWKKRIEYKESIKNFRAITINLLSKLKENNEAYKNLSDKRWEKEKYIKKGLEITESIHYELWILSRKQNKK